jgi:hypothetical protein
MSADLMVAWATFLLVLATVVLVWVTLKGIREQLWLMTFSEYTRRYAEIMDVLPFEARRPGGHYDHAAISPAERDGALGAMRQYLNLCSEELYLHSRKRIDHNTWEIWTTGIRDTVRLPFFKFAWQVLRPEYDYYSDFSAFMDSLTQEANRSADELGR